MFDYDHDLNDSITSVVLKTDDQEFNLSRVNSIEFEFDRLYLTYKSCRENDLLLQKHAKSVTINFEATSTTYKVSDPRIEDLALYPSRLLDLEEAQINRNSHMCVSFDVEDINYE